MGLQENSDNVPYNLGRLFAVLEIIQNNANPQIKTTIVDTYLNSASTNPINAFPALLNLTQKHLSKLSPGLQNYWKKKLDQLMLKIPDNFPTYLNIQQQGAFHLGYYHQHATYYLKKEEQ